MSALILAPAELVQLAPRRISVATSRYASVHACRTAGVEPVAQALLDRPQERRAHGLVVRVSHAVVAVLPAERGHVRHQCLRPVELRHDLGQRFPRASAAAWPCRCPRRAGGPRDRARRAARRTGRRPAAASVGSGASSRGPAPVVSWSWVTSSCCAACGCRSQAASAVGTRGTGCSPVTSGITGVVRIGRE